MKFPYSETGSGPTRPMLDLGIGNAGFHVKRLLDTGSVHTVFPSWVARRAAIDISNENETRVLRLGGMTLEVTFVTVQLSFEDFDWEAEVGFCDGWDSDWGLLGQESFFRKFTVTFRAVDEVFEIERNTE